MVSLLNPKSASLAMARLPPENMRMFSILMSRLTTPHAVAEVHRHHELLEDPAHLLLRQPRLLRGHVPLEVAQVGVLHHQHQVAVRGKHPLQLHHVGVAQLQLVQLSLRSVYLELACAGGVWG